MPESVQDSVHEDQDQLASLQVNAHDRVSAPTGGSLPPLTTVAADASAPERGLYLNAAAAVPATAVAGLDGPIAAPARDESDPVRRGPASRSRSGSGASRPSASRLIAGACPPRRQRAQSAPRRSRWRCRLAQRGSGPAPSRCRVRCRCRQAPVPAAPGTLRRGLSTAPFGQIVAGADQRATIAPARPRPTVPDQSWRRWASAGGRLRLASAVPRRAPTEASPSSMATSGRLKTRALRAGMSRDRCPCGRGR